MRSARLLLFGVPYFVLQSVAFIFYALTFGVNDVAWLMYAMAKYEDECCKRSEQP